MKAVLFALAAAAASAAMPQPAAAMQKPPLITWDWYRAAEIYLKQDRKGANELAIAAHYHRLAAEKGNSASAYKLGEMYEKGMGVRQNNREAFRWYKAAAEQNNKYAQFRVGWFYQYGLAVPKNMATAARWYSAAAEQDNEWGLHMLAFMYADGDGVRKDTALAKRYFEASLPRTKDAWARVKLASLIERDDPREARRLLREAAAQGNQEARKQLAGTNG